MKDSHLQYIIDKIGGYDEGIKEFVDWFKPSPEDLKTIKQLEFVNDIVNPEFDDNDHRCICHQELMNIFYVINKDKTKYCVIGSTCIHYFGMSKEYGKWYRAEQDK